MRVDDGLPTGTLITNQATIYSDELPALLSDGDGDPTTGPEPTVVIVGDAPVMEARLLRLAGSGAEQEILFETCIKPLVHAARETSFVF